LWATPVRVEVLDLDNFKGGLVPIKKGGGYQTKSLRFKSKDGTIWKFRSVNKDPKKVLPPELQESFVGDVLQDQISTSNPVAPLVVVPLLEAVDILQAKPTLVLLPDDEKLGEFREEFGGLLGMIEIHPDEPDIEDEAGFANSEKVSGTFKLLETLEEKRNQKVDDREFFKARLMDIFLGDWDRHTDQWRWARYDEGEKKTWLPIPRDRDQVFAKYDGLLPPVVAYLIPQLNHFDYDYTQAEDITWNGRFLDRRFLSELNKPTWDSVTAFVHSRLTDEVIEKAVKQLPDEYYQKAGDEITSKLKSRRDRLFEISNEFYELENEVVDIYGSSKDDLFEINRLNDLQTEVTLLKKNKDDDENEEILYHKIFDNDLTDELRLYLLDKDDEIILRGEVDFGPLVRIIGGKGKDKVIDSSVVNGYFLHLTPIPDAENKTVFYDSGDKTEIVYGPGTCLDVEEVPEPQTISERYEPEQRDRGHNWLILPMIGINSDDGFIFGGGPLLYSYNFRVSPYEYKMMLTGSFATRPSSYTISYKGDFYSLIKNTKVHLALFRSKLLLTRYYGYGNETPFDIDLEANDFYQINQELTSFHPEINIFLTKNVSVGLGLSYNYSDISLKNDTLLSTFGTDYGIGNFSLGGVHASLGIDTRDNEMNAYEGSLVRLEVSFYPEMLDNKKNFTSAGFDLRTFFSGNLITDVTLGLRAGGKKLWGTYPFFKAAFLGGPENLRGYSRERYAGDAYLFGQTELRTYLTDMKLILLGRFGFHLFAESGRVYTEGTESEKWHPSYGGGLWISYLKKQLTLTLTLANSTEKLAFYLQAGFMF
jgi:hypothetical protein